MPSAFSFTQVTKRFGSVCANDGVSFEVEAGTIHGVVGENGAGKSTILKTLYGLYRPDSGDIHVRGEKVDFRSPQDALARGIGMVHQHFMLVPTLSVWQNVVLGEEPFAWKPNRAASIAALKSIQAEFGFSLDLDARVETLPVGLQQQVEILKLLYRKADTLIFDEPTAVLTPQEVTLLIERLRKLKNEGKTIVFISHKLREVLTLTEKVTILRQGKVVGSWQTAELDESSLAEKIVGRKVQPLPARKQSAATTPLIEVKNLSLEGPGRPILQSVSFSLRPGEIVGVAGVDGNGQQELIEILAKTREDYAGEVLWEGKPYRAQDCYRLKQSGLAVIAPDRHREAMILDFSLCENVLLGHHRETKYGKRRLDWTTVEKSTRAIIERFDVRPALPQAQARGLSGGNQQKLVIGRELGEGVKFLLAAHPTRGVDIGAIERIHSEILRLRDAGAAVLLFSSELEEILALSDRVLVIYNGRIQGETPRSQATETQLGLWMTGGAK
ncbi:ABC transporter ATP-binding protein [bacterium]|nr:ABC transporter ATP-binding protein [bacterium]